MLVRKSDITLVLLIVAVCIVTAFTVFVFAKTERELRTGVNAANREQVYQMCMDGAPDTSKAKSNQEYEELFSEWLNYKEECSKLLT